MEITFMKNNSDDDTINKSLEIVQVMTGALRNDCSIENPEIIVEVNGVIPANYCYIAEFGRYYFITNQVILSNNRNRIMMEVDVLQSYKDEILNLDCIIDDSSNINNNYLSSELWVANVKNKTKILNFPSGLSDSGEFILITSGG